MTSPNLVFEYNTAGALPNPTTAVITASAFNTESTPYYTFFKNNSEVQAASTSPYYTYSAPAAYANMPEELEVELREGSSTGSILARDQQSTTGLMAGTNAITIDISNENVSVPVSNAGTFDYSNTGVNIRVWEGTTDLLNVKGIYTSPVPGSFLVWPTSSNVSSGTETGGNTYTASFGNVSALSSSGAQIEYRIEVKDLAGEQTTHYRTQNFNQSVDGEGAITCWLDQPVKALPSTASNGQVSDFTDSGTLIYASEGTASLVYDAIGTSAGKWRVTGTATNVTHPAPVDSGDYATAGNITAFSASSPTGKIIWLIEGKRFGGAEFTPTQKYIFELVFLSSVSSNQSFQKV